MPARPASSIAPTIEAPRVAFPSLNLPLPAVISASFEPLAASFQLPAHLFDAATALPPVRGAAARPHESAPAPRMPADALAVPAVSQAYDYSCGAAALTAVLYYWQVFEGHETDLYAALETTPKDGTEPRKLEEVAKSFGLSAAVKRDMTLDDLKDSLWKGETVILDIQAWRDKPGGAYGEDWDDGHYVVLIGMDERYAYVMDPSAVGGYAYIPLPELLERWHDAEDRHGRVERNVHLGVAISGAGHRGGTPGEPGPVGAR